MIGKALCWLKKCGWQYGGDDPTPPIELSVYSFSFGAFGLLDVFTPDGDAQFTDGGSGLQSFLASVGFTQSGELWWGVNFSNGQTQIWIECETGTEPTDWTYQKDGGSVDPIVFNLIHTPSVYKCYEWEIDVSLGGFLLSDFWLDPVNTEVGQTLVTGAGMTPIDDPSYPAEFASYVTLAFGAACSTQVIINSPTSATIRIINTPIAPNIITANRISVPGQTDVNALEISCP